MQIIIAGSAAGRGEQHQYLISYVVNRHIAIDAGCIGCITPLADQKALKHVFLSHTHIDHTASLPCFLDNVFEPNSEGVRLYASQATAAGLARDFFNDSTWPDLVRLSREESPFFTLELLVSEQSVAVEDLRVLPVELNHVVPTLGFVISDERSSVAIVSDTAPSDRIWQVLNEVPNLRAVFLEASFPNSMS
ncbi:MAG TPA: MBL fold metallo-hydrolase, partial [Pirellulales bacterium]|nr:MBL fold metallo-hydrolase [Pirellulales bacterium]